MIGGGTIRDQTDGCAKKYRRFIVYYMMYFLSKSYEIVLDRAVDTLGHGKYVVDGFNAAHKLFLATCLRMLSTPEVDKVDSNCIRIDDMTKMGEVRFDEECNRLLDLHDEIGTKSDKKHAKREAKARLKHK